MVMNFVLLPLLFLSGAFFPLNGLPRWLAVLTRLDPAAYAVDALRRTVLVHAGTSPEALAQLSLAGPGGAPLPVAVEVGVLALFGVVTVSVAARWFGRSE